MNKGQWNIIKIIKLFIITESHEIKISDKNQIIYQWFSFYFHTANIAENIILHFY